MLDDQTRKDTTVHIGEMSRLTEIAMIVISNIKNSSNEPQCCLIIRYLIQLHIKKSKKIGFPYLNSSTQDLKFNDHCNVSAFNLCLMYQLVNSVSIQTLLHKVMK